jgi:hypothetical protein
MSDRPPPPAKLFRAVVVLGTALTSGCGDAKPTVDAAVIVADAKPHDAATTDAAPTDALTADAVIIL